MSESDKNHSKSLFLISIFIYMEQRDKLAKEKAISFRIGDTSLVKILYIEIEYG